MSPGRLRERFLGTVTRHRPAETAVTDPSPTAGRRVRLDGLSAFYGAHRVLKSVSLTFEPNRVTALIGPSGSGKSTVVRCINRMHEEVPGARAEGRVLLDDLDVSGDEVDAVAVRRAIGMVFQKPNPFPTMSVAGNVGAGLRLAGVRGRALEERVERSLRGAGLWGEVKDRLDQPGVGLSGGQQQRLCIARAIGSSATLRVEELIAELKQRYTIAIVTHNLQQAARVADSTAFLLDGEVIEAGPTERIFTNPRDQRTEHYVSGKFG